MAQYIDKSAVVAEIERIKKSIGPDGFLSKFEKGCNHGKEDVCDDLLSFLDTLEVKDVFKEKQRLIEKTCKLMQQWILEHDYVDIMELEDYVKQKMES